jgi:hypothetical protein
MFIHSRPPTYNSISANIAQASPVKIYEEMLSSVWQEMHIETVLNKSLHKGKTHLQTAKL